VRLLVTTNLPYKILSVLIALALWFIVRDERIESTVTFALDVQPPADFVVSNEQVPDLTVSVQGTRAALSRLRGQNLAHVVQPSITEPGPVTLRIRPEELELPAGVEAISVSPSSAQVRLESRATRRVPVKARLLVANGTGYRVRKVTITPERVKVAGPTSVVGSLDEVWTEAIEITPRGVEPITGQYAVSLPHKQLRLEDKGPVSVKIEIEEAPPDSPDPSPTPAGLKVNAAPSESGRAAAAGLPRGAARSGPADGLARR
jgi:hypothetical protein